MTFRSLLTQAILLLSTLASFTNAQGTFAYYTDNSTGIKFWQNTIPSGEDTTGGFQFGVALPPNGTGDNTEYIGRVQGALHNGTLRQGWSGISHGGEMTDSLLLLFWPDPSTNNSIKTSFRLATDYVAPSMYTGNAIVTPVKQTVSDSSFELIYRCQHCLAWTINGTSYSQLPGQQSAAEIIGWVQAFAAPSDPSSTTAAVKFHDNGYGEFGVVVANATNPDYSSYLEQISSGTASSGNASTVLAAATATPPADSSISLPFPTGAFPGVPSGFQTLPRPAGTGSPFANIFHDHKHDHKHHGTGRPFGFPTGGFPMPTGSIYGGGPMDPTGHVRRDKHYKGIRTGTVPPWAFPTGGGLPLPSGGVPMPTGSIYGGGPRVGPTPYMRRG